MIDYKALAERVAQRVIYADNNADPSNTGWAADLRAVVSLPNGMADAQPVAWRCEVRGDGTRPALGASDWRHYATTTNERTAQAFLSRCGDGIEGRVVPLTAAPAAPQAEQPIDLDAVAMQQMRQAAAESTWMPSEYTSNDWIADVCRWLRDGPPAAAPQAEPIDPHMIVADDRFPDEQAEPKREPLGDWRIAEEVKNRQIYGDGADAFYEGVRWAEHSHGIGGSDAE